MQFYFWSKILCVSCFHYRLLNLAIFSKLLNHCGRYLLPVMPRISSKFHCQMAVVYSNWPFEIDFWVKIPVNTWRHRALAERFRDSPRHIWTLKMIDKYRQQEANFNNLLKLTTFHEYSRYVFLKSRLMIVCWWRKCCDVSHLPLWQSDITRRTRTIVALRDNKIKWHQWQWMVDNNPFIMSRF